ncbi:MAG TPA: transcription antitermination factor NusB [Gaiellales bacterium]|jgi:16S rRNA (cytosine967-C5)-methyltransferase
MTPVAPARRVAYEVVRRTFEQGAYADRAFAGAAGALDPRERRQAMRLAFGAVQRMRTVDHAVEQLAGRRPMRLQAELRNALRVSGYEVLFSDAVPARAAVSEGVELARSVAGGRIAGLANAVLRRLADAGAGWVDGLPPPLRLSYPDWVWDAWVDLLGEEGAAACGDAQNQPPELSLRVNTLRAGRVDLGVPAHEVPGLPEALVLDEVTDVTASRAFASGAVWPQSRSSMRPGRVLAPEPGMRVADLCAAPGGKAGQLAALMEDRGELVCVERHAGRAAELVRTLERFGATCARVVVADVVDFAGGPFDRILLDPPCSGLGVLAGRPDARWRRTPEDAAELAALQRAMLEHAIGLLAPGGVLVYSVCTLRREECEAIAPGGDYLLPYVEKSDGFYIARVEA